HDRLPRGVAGADDDDRVAAALRRLAAPGAVVDAAVEQLLDASDLQPAPLHPTGGDHDRGLYPEVALQVDLERLGPAAAAAGDAAPEDQLRPEPFGLPPG